jgi:hypothetical protein
MPGRVDVEFDGAPMQSHASEDATVSIPVIADRTLKYFHLFDLSALGKTRDGRILVTKDPFGLEVAWWGRATDLGAVLARARADSQDVVRAAQELRIKVVEHAQALQNADQLISKLDARMSSAQQEGELKAFNRAYKEHRLARFREGKSSMTYAQARARLRTELAAIASGKQMAAGSSLAYSRNPTMGSRTRDRPCCGPWGAADWRASRQISLFGSVSTGHNCGPFERHTRVAAQCKAKQGWKGAA